MNELLEVQSLNSRLMRLEEPQMLIELILLFQLVFDWRQQLLDRLLELLRIICLI